MSADAITAAYQPVIDKARELIQLRNSADIRAYRDYSSVLPATGGEYAALAGALQAVTGELLALIDRQHAEITRHAGNIDRLAESLRDA